MTDKRNLTVADFKNATVYGCGLERKDPQRGYEEPAPVQQTSIAGMIDAKEANLRSSGLGNQR